MGEFTYLPYCIVLVCLEYVAIVKGTLVWTARRDENRERSDRVSFRHSQSTRRWLGVFDQRSFLSVCSGLYGPTSSILLFFTRLLSCLFFVVIGR
jgi:hypothetical protein